MENLVIIAIVLVIIGMVIMYLRKAKKRGEHCIGCPYSGKCSHCGCNEHKSIQLPDVGIEVVQKKP